MVTSGIEKATTFLEAIASKNADLATTYIDPDRYVEHNPLVADGAFGLMEYVGHPAEQGADLEVLRAFEDENYVVTQTQHGATGKKVLFDVFKLEDGLIIEHWAFSAESGPPNKSGHTQADGPTEPNPNENGDESKSIVRGYYEAVHLSGDRSKIPMYFSGDHCIRHEPGVVDGVSAFMRDLAVLTQRGTIEEIRLLLAQGDFVFLAAKGTVEGRPCAYIDLYRVEAGKIVEHWGFPQEIPPQREWRNNHGFL
ncbi:MAG: nuclear transport factor 2 family protein [Acetobacteraceae bacterium]